MKITDAMVECVARSLAKDEWPLATDLERKRWEDRHWSDYLNKARNALQGIFNQQVKQEG